MRICAVLVYLFSSVCLAQTQLVGTEQLRQQLGLKSWAQKIKVAVLDNGFGDFRSRPSGTYLPETAQLIEKYPQDMILKYDLNPDFAGNKLTTDNHGLRMAQIISSLAGRSVELFLLNTNGFTNFRRAVRYAIEEQVDFILYSQNWEYGGNFDGGGFINQVVNQASDAGIIWVNAAGNYGGHVHESHFNGESQIAFEVPLDDFPVAITLAWNDRTHNIGDQAQNDLSLELLNANGEVVSLADKAQVDLGDERKPSRLAREKMQLTLDRGHYRLRVKSKRGQPQKIRVTFVPERGELLLTHKTPNAEIMIPADNPNVLTIGDASKHSSLGVGKPDFVFADSTASFSNGMQTRGSSNAAAFMTAILAVMQTVSGPIDLNRVKNNSSCLKTLEESDFTYDMIDGLARMLGDDFAEVEFAQDPTGRKIVLLPYQPVNTRLYGPVVAPELHDFYLFDSNNPNKPFGLETLIRFKGSPVGLHWVQLIDRREAQNRCGAPHSPRLWRTPDFY